MYQRITDKLLPVETEKRRSCFSPAVLIFIAGLLGGLGIRLYGIGDDSLWFDEAVTAMYTSTGAVDALQANRGDSTPPLYFVGLAAWRKLQPATEAGLRVYSALWSVIGIAAAGLLAGQLSGRRAAAVAVLLMAINPVDVYFAQEARPYAQAAALCSAAMLLLWVLVFSEKKISSTTANCLGAAYGICAASIFLTHYAACAVLIGHAMVVLLLLKRRQRPLLAPAATALIPAVAISGPWIYYVLSSPGGLNTSNAGWMAWPRFSDYVLLAGQDLFWGHARITSPVAWLTAAVVMPATSAAVFFERQQRKSEGKTTTPIAFSALLILLPVMAATIISLLVGQSIFLRSRFAVFVLPAFICLLALSTNTKTGRRWCALAGATMIVGLLWQDRTAHKIDWRSFARIYRKDGPPDRIAFFPSYNVTSANHYLYPRVRNFTLGELQAAFPYLSGQSIWLVHEDGFALPLQTGEIQMRDVLRSLGNKNSISAPEGLTIEEIRVR